MICHCLVSFGCVFSLMIDLLGRETPCKRHTLVLSLIVLLLIIFLNVVGSGRQQTLHDQRALVWLCQKRDLLSIATVMVFPGEQWGTCALRHRGRESQYKACLGACLGGIAFCGQLLCFAFQSFRHRSAVFLNKVLHQSEVLVLV